MEKSRETRCRQAGQIVACFAVHATQPAPHASIRSRPSLSTPSAPRRRGSAARVSFVGSFGGMEPCGALNDNPCVTLVAQVRYLWLGGLGSPRIGNVFTPHRTPPRLLPPLAAGWRRACAS